MLRKLLFKSNTAVALLLGALVAIAYVPILNVPFLANDYASIWVVARSEGGTDWWSVLYDFYNPIRNFDELFPIYRPLYTLSFGLEYSLYGAEPFGYHVTNLALHAINSFFVYLVALELVPGERKRWIAVTAGAIFALHPIHPEAVTFISARTDALCAVFYLPALLFFLRWLRTEQRFYVALSVIFFALALLSKEMAAALPGLLFLCAIYKRKRVTTAVLSMAPFAVTLGIYLLLWFRFVSYASRELYEELPGIAAIFEGFLAWTLHAFFPLNLELLPDEWSIVADDGISISTVLPFELILAIGSIMLIAVSIVAARCCRAEGKFLILLFMLYAVSLAPVFRTLFFWNPVLMTSRWFYIPSAFLSLFVAYVLWSVAGRYARGSLIPSIAAGLVCVTFLAILVINNGAWIRAGEIAREHLESGKEPETLPLIYKGAYVFSEKDQWEAANDLPFKEP